MRWLHSLLDWILPDTCILCRQALLPRAPHLLCEYCWASLPRNTPACAHCAIALPSAGICGACVQRPLLSNRCLAALQHRADASRLVHQLKYAHNLRAGTCLAQTVCQAVQFHYRDEILPQALVPVPLSYRRQVARGYNQAVWLAHQIGRQMQIPVLYHHLSRRHRPAQQTMSRRQRLTLRSSDFTLQRPMHAAHVAIIDDVMTTGATVRALENTLTAHGVGRVDVWCATRAELA
jgi:ComF family protein